MNLLDRAENHRRRQLDGPAHEVPGAVIGDGVVTVAMDGGPVKAVEHPFPRVGRTLSGPPTPAEPSADGHTPTQMLTGVVWSAWVQRCGTESSCDCHRGPKGDAHEREADRTAERIVSQPECHEQVSRSSQPPGSPAPSSSNPKASTALVGQLGPGRALPEWVRGHFEARLDADLGDVRIHTGDASHRAAESLHANAFTVGSHVGFRAGRFAPGTAEGQRLLAHEISHVLQQRHGGAGPARRCSASRALGSQPAAGRRPGHRR